jgi:galactosylceramidase
MLFAFALLSLSRKYAVDGAAVGPEFDGHGGLSAGGSSRLLRDYPEPQRSDILDFLFAPEFARVAVLKLEIGGDTQSTDGSEPSHMHSRGDLSCTRGYEGWLAAEAVKRNPDIKVWSLSWGVPGWVGNSSGNPSTYYCDDQIAYQLSWLKCLRDAHGVESNYIGLWNERPQGSTEYVVQLRKALDAGGFPDVGITVEASWQPLINNVLTNAAFNASVAAASKHYPCNSTCSAALAAGKKFWAGEDVPTGYANWTAASCWGRKLNQHYVKISATSTVSWALLWAAYPGESLTFAGYGFVTANEPWSAHYDVSPTVWVMAHWGQFVQPGWRFLAVANATARVVGGAGFLAEGGSYVTLVPPSRALRPTGDAYPPSTFVMVIETLQGACGAQGGCNVDAFSATQSVAFELRGPLAAARRVALWCSSADAVFVRRPDVPIAAGGVLALTMAPDTICTATTLLNGGVTKGRRASPPPSRAFPTAHADDFNAAAEDALAWGFGDVYGSFAVRAYSAEGGGKALTQVATAVPTGWAPTNYDPMTMIGGNWSSVDVSVRAKVNGTVRGAYVRVCATGCGGINARGIKYGCDPGCCFNVSAAGAWTAGAGATSVNGTVVGFTDSFHEINVSVAPTGALRAAVDGVDVAHIPGSCATPGLVSLGCGKYHECAFDEVTLDRGN